MGVRWIVVVSPDELHAFVAWQVFSTWLDLVRLIGDSIVSTSPRKGDIGRLDPKPNAGVRISSSISILWFKGAFM